MFPPGLVGQGPHRGQLLPRRQDPWAMLTILCLVYICVMPTGHESTIRVPEVPAQVKGNSPPASTSPNTSLSPMAGRFPRPGLSWRSGVPAAESFCRTPCGAVVGAVACPARWLPGIALGYPGGASPSPTLSNPKSVDSRGISQGTKPSSLHPESKSVPQSGTPQFFILHYPFFILDASPQLIEISL